jgi:hypothetical protein
MVSASVRRLNHLMPMGCEQGKSFKSSFQTSRFAPTGAFRDETCRNGVTKQADHVALFSRVGDDFVEFRLPLPQGLDTGFEADSARGGLNLIGRVKHQQPNRVIRDEVHQGCWRHDWPVPGCSGANV